MVGASIILMAGTTCGQTAHLNDGEKGWWLGASYSHVEDADSYGIVGARAFSNNFDFGLGIAKMSATANQIWPPRRMSVDRTAISQRISFYTEPRKDDRACVILGLHEAYYLFADEDTDNIWVVGGSLNIRVPTSQTGGYILYSGLFTSQPAGGGNSTEYVPVGIEIFGATSPSTRIAGYFEYSIAEGPDGVGFGVSMSFID